MITAQTVQQTYDKCSSFYDLFFEPWLESGRKKALQSLDLKRGDTLLEIGIGTGLGLHLYPPDINLIAFDYSYGMLSQSKNKAKDSCPCTMNLIQMDVQSMAFPDHSFDHILAAYVLTVVPDLEKSIAEILRVARPGAKVVIINHLPSSGGFFSCFESFFHPLFTKIGLFTLDRNIPEVLHSFGINDIEIEPSTFLGLHYVISFRVPSK